MSPSSIVYRVSTTPRNLNAGIWLENHEFGVAYEVNDTFVHMFADSNDVICDHGLASEKGKFETVSDWARHYFGATEITQSKYTPGTVVDGVWRPGLIDDDQFFARKELKALGWDEVDRRRSEQELGTLLERLSELLLFVEPETANMATFGLKQRELLILACTEIEDGWKQLLRKAGYRSGNVWTTNDYVKLKEPLHLHEFLVAMPAFSAVRDLKPFYSWSASGPTKSLSWYDAYNKVKHDKSANLHKATLETCLEAVAAVSVLYCARFGQPSLRLSLTPGSSLFAQLFEVVFTPTSSLPESCYVPILEPSDFYLKTQDGLGWSILTSSHSASVGDNWVKNPLVIL